MLLFGAALLLDALIDPLYISAVYSGHSGLEMRAEVAAKLMESVTVWVLIRKSNLVWHQTQHYTGAVARKLACVCTGM
jgi:hypothetical protein